MAVEVATMGPVLVQGKQVTAAVETGCCSRKGYQADHRSCASAGVSLFAAAGRSVPQVQPQHLMKQRYLGSDQAGF